MSKITEVKGSAISAVFEADDKATAKSKCNAHKAMLKAGLMDILNKHGFAGNVELVDHLYDPKSLYR